MDRVNFAAGHLVYSSSQSSSIGLINSSAGDLGKLWAIGRGMSANGHRAVSCLSCKASYDLSLEGGGQVNESGSSVDNGAEGTVNLVAVDIGSSGGDLPLQIQSQ